MKGHEGLLHDDGPVSPATPGGGMRKQRRGRRNEVDAELQGSAPISSSSSLLPHSASRRRRLTGPAALTACQPSLLVCWPHCVKAVYSGTLEYERRDAGVLLRPLSLKWRSALDAPRVAPGRTVSKAASSGWACMCKG